MKQSIYEGKNYNSEILHILKERLKKTHRITLQVDQCHRTTDAGESTRKKGMPHPHVGANNTFAAVLCF